MRPSCGTGFAAAIGCGVAAWFAHCQAFSGTRHTSQIATEEWIVQQELATKRIARPERAGQQPKERVGDRK
jgi:hypothetical protein